MCQSCETQLQAFDACGPTAGRDTAGRLTATYQAAHNDYVLQLCAANALHRHYHNTVLPATLKVCRVRSFLSRKSNMKAVLSQGNHAMPQLFFRCKVRRQHSLQV